MTVSLGTFDYEQQWAFCPENKRKAYLARQQEELYAPYGGKDGFEAHCKEVDAERLSLESLPEMPEILAVLWADRLGEGWDDLSPVQREVRVSAMKTQIYRETIR